MTDVFAIQEEIATAIAGALRTPLGLKDGEQLIVNRTKDLDSYQQYLRAKAGVRARGLKPLNDSIQLLEEVVAHDPDFAPAWSLLSLAFNYVPTFHPAFWSGSVEDLRRLVDTLLPKAEAAAERAIQLDPSLSEAYLSQAIVQERRGKLLVAEDLYLKALALDPYNPDVLHAYANLFALLGQSKDSLKIREQLLTLEPFVPVFVWNTAVIRWENGQTDAAIALTKTLPSIPPRAFILAEIYAAMGRYAEAADALLETPAGELLPGTEEAIRLLRSAPAKTASPYALPHFPGFGFVYLYVGAPERALEDFERMVDANYLVGGITSQLWHSSYAPVHKTERFKAFIRRTGMIEYWRQKGWPERCHPIGTDDFLCG